MCYVLDWLNLQMTCMYSISRTYSCHTHNLFNTCCAHHVPRLRLTPWHVFNELLKLPQQQRPEFRSETPGCSDCLWRLLRDPYPATGNYMLPVAQVTGRVAQVPSLDFRDVYAPSEQHLCYSCLHNALQCLCLSPAAASLWMPLMRLEIIATTNCSTIFKTYAFSLYSHLYEYVSI